LQRLSLHLEALDEIGGAHEQHAVAALDQRAAERRSGVALAAAGGTEQQQIGALAQPGVAGGERHDVRLADHRHCQEVKVVERLARRQACLGKVALEGAARVLDDR
jgi:hypothetical protein